MAPILYYDVQDTIECCHSILSYSHVILITFSFGYNLFNWSALLNISDISMLSVATKQKGDIL